MQPRNLTTLIFLLFVITHSLYAQNPQWKWAKTSNGDNILQSDNDSVGNTYVMGEFYGTNGIEIDHTPYDATTADGEVKSIYMAKFNAAGKLVWAHIFYGDEMNSEINGIRFDINARGDVAIIAESENNTIVHVGRYDLEFLAPTRNVFVTKISKSGFILWTRKIEITEGTTNITSGSDIVLANNGKVAVTGTFNGDAIAAGIYSAPGLGNNDMMYVVKYNAVGDEEWIKSVEYNGTPDTLFVNGLLVNCDEEENIYVAGTYDGVGDLIFNADTSVNNTGKNIFLVKYLGNGDVDWAKFISGDNEDVPENMVVDHNGDILFLGLFESTEVDVQGILIPNSGNYFDQFITKISGNGVRIFAKHIQSQINFLNNLRKNSQLFIDNNNNIFIATSFTTATSLSDVNTVVNAETGTSDLLFIKYEPVNGNIVWSLSGSQVGNNNLGAAGVDKYGNFYTTSDLNNNISMNGTDLIDTDGYGGFYVTKITANGTVDFGAVKLNPSSGSALTEDIGVDVFGNVYLTGQYGGTGMSFGNTDIANAPDGGQFFAKLSLTSQLSGQVINSDGQPVSNGYVYLIGHTRFQRSPVNDSIMLSDGGNFEFIDVPYGRYILSAVPHPDAMWLQTYYPEEDYWENAERIIVDSPQPQDNLNIIVFSKEELTGQNGLEGNLSRIEEIDVFKSGNQMNPVPMRDASVVLLRNKLKSDYEVVAVTYSDINGNFAFYDVNDGYYQLYVDVPGIVQTDYYEVYVSGGQLASNLDYYMDEETISKVYITPVKKNTIVSIPVRITPNPAHDYVYIQMTNLNSENIHYRIFDTYGRMVQEGRIDLIDQISTLDISRLTDGGYFLKLMDNEQAYTQKFIKY